METKLPPVQPVPPLPSAAGSYGGGLDGKQDAAKFRRPAEPEASAAEPAGKDPPAAAPALLATDLRIEVDREAQRFVMTHTDPDTGEAVKQFPSEAQLAFARALNQATRPRFDVET